MDLLKKIEQNNSGIWLAFERKIKKIIPFYIPPFFESRRCHNWEKGGKVSPPPYRVKWDIILGYAQQYSLDAFIETGTYMGHTVFAMKDKFSRVDSIELDDGYYRRAKRIFSRYKNVTIHHGDSQDVLLRILESVNTPCLFWLDAHYCGATTARGKLYSPIMHEVDIILASPVSGHVILIDDADCFVGECDYPTQERFLQYVREKKPNLRIEIQDNIIRITP